MRQGDGSGFDGNVVDGSLEECLFLPLHVQFFYCSSRTTVIEFVKLAHSTNDGCLDPDTVRELKSLIKQHQLHDGNSVTTPFIAETEPSHSAPQPSLEICCFSLPAVQTVIQSQIVARIELCSMPEYGGMTPIDAILSHRTQDKSLRDYLAEVNRTHSIRIMIRPTHVSFHYSEDEFQAMQVYMALADECNQGGPALIAEGFVFGILTEDGEVDVARCKILVQMAQKCRPAMKCTFHRAFDSIRDKMNGLEMLIGCGFHAVLTSGLPGNAVENTAVLKQLVEQAAGRIEVIVGGGVRSGVMGVLRETGAPSFHSAATLNGSHMPDAMELQELSYQIRRRR